MADKEIYTYFVGTAGSGKSTITARFKQWCELQNIDAIIVNLDPGAENLPYTPDVDICDWISLQEIMKSHGLGPNGAQIACADMIALNIDELRKSIDSFHCDYILMDTPGQLELFVFRESGKHIIEYLSPNRSVIAYLIDHILARNPSGFVSQLLLSLSTNFRLQIPQINILSKADLLETDEKKMVLEWSQDTDLLYEALLAQQPSIYREMTEGILRLLENFQSHASLYATGKDDFLGIEDMYTAIQLLYMAGEDLGRD